MELTTRIGALRLSLSWSGVTASPRLETHPIGLVIEGSEIGLSEAPGPASLVLDRRASEEESLTYMEIWRCSNETPGEAPAVLLLVLCDPPIQVDRSLVA